jgi:hypothetical protein
MTERDRRPAYFARLPTAACPTSKCVRWSNHRLADSDCPRRPHPNDASPPAGDRRRATGEPIGGSDRQSDQRSAGHRDDPGDMRSLSLQAATQLKQTKNGSHCLTRPDVLTCRRSCAEFSVARHSTYLPGASAATWSRPAGEDVELCRATASAEDIHIDGFLVCGFRRSRGWYAALAGQRERETAGQGVGAAVRML